MKSYMKPTISLAVTSAGSGLTDTCFVKADMELIQSIIGGADASNTFGMNEPCGVKVPLEIYCKFTSAELGAAQAFIS